MIKELVNEAAVLAAYQIAKERYAALGVKKVPGRDTKEEGG